MTPATAAAIVPPVDREELKRLVREVFEDEVGYGYTPIAERFSGGTMLIKPRDDSLQAKEVPLDTFFHKIVIQRPAQLALATKQQDARHRVRRPSTGS